VSRLKNLSLRTRLAVALVGTALLAVGLATLLVQRGLHPRLSDAAEARLDSSANRLAEIASGFYGVNGGWTTQSVHDLEHLALLNRLDLELVDARGRALTTSQADGIAELTPRAGATRSIPIRIGGRTVGVATIRPVGGTLLTPEETHLESSLDRLHLVAAAISAAAALVLAFILAETLSRPLRRIRDGARRIDEGRLETRVEPGGGAEMRAVGDALNRLAATLEREDELRRESVADLAHELRTPVSGLLSRIEAAQDHVLASDEENLAAMHEEAMRLTRLLDDLARLADAERPGLLIEKRRLDLAEVASASAASFEPRFAQQGVELLADLRHTLVTGDPDRLGQIVANLLSNALFYTDPGGTVTMSVRPGAGCAVLEIRDTGIGIRAEDLPHVFERFWRGEKSRSRATGGAGIGLAIVQELVRAHEGSVEVESETGIGSCFRVTLPLVRSNVLAMPPVPTAPENPALTRLVER